MPQIFLDVTRLVRRLQAGLLPTGVDRVGLAYIEHYAHRARAVLSERGYSVILSERDSQSIFKEVFSATRQAKFKRLAAKGIFGGALVTQRFDNAVLLHTSHNGMEFQRYYKTMKKRGIHPVFMIHDLIPLTHAEYCRPGVNETHRRRIHTALRHADGLIGNSQATLDDLSLEASKAGLPVPASVVARLASGVAETNLVAAPFGKPYFLLLGTIEPRKNHWFTLHLWRRLVETLGDAAPTLVIVGRRGWECENVIDMLERCDALRKHVIERSDCADTELRSWMQHARALLFPSFVEGYGMPLVEALAAGTPVIASNLAVFKEISGDIPDYLDPLDGPAWIARVLDYAQEESPARNAQLSRIGGFKEPTWAEHFACVDGFLETLRR